MSTFSILIVIHPPETKILRAGFFADRAMLFAMRVASLRKSGVGFALISVCLEGCSIPSGRPPQFSDKAELGAFYESEAGIVATPVSNPQLHDSCTAIKAEILSLIGKAEKFILIDSFLLTTGPETREIFDALEEKVSEGVDVRVIGDTSSRFVPEPPAFEDLTERGVPVAEFNPARGWRLALLPILLERDHRKFLVIDGRWVSLGGANINDPSLIPPESGGNRDLMLTVDSPEAAGELARSFVKTWNESDGPERLKVSDFPVAGPLDGEGLEVRFFNQEKIIPRPSLTTVMMEGLFASATETVWLVEPYTFVNPAILSDIVTLTDRGVEVNVILSSLARAPRFRYASHFGIKDLIQVGAKVWIFDSKVSPLHYKCAVVDDDLAYVGSANLNLRSFHLSRELNAVFDDPATVAGVRRVVDSVLNDCRPVKMDEAASYRKPRYFMWWAIMQVAG